MTSWSTEDIEKLEDLFYLATSKELKQAFPERSLDAVKRKAYRLGLDRHDNIERITAVKKGTEIDLSRVDDSFGNFLSGFVAGEGTFTQSSRPNGKSRYRFCIQLANDDKEILNDIQNVFRCGSLNEYKPRSTTEKGSVQYQINGYGQLVNKVIPFFDEYGFYSTRKQNQYNSWKRDLLADIPSETFK